MKLRRKPELGVHRARVPGHGIISIFPNMVVPGDHDSLDFLGNQKDDYIIIGGAPPPKEAEPEARELSPPKIRVTEDGRYNVVHGNTGEFINKYPLSLDAAIQFLELLEDECPMEDGKFGETFDDFIECSNCANSEDCQKANQCQA